MRRIYRTVLLLACLASGSTAYSQVTINQNEHPANAGITERGVFFKAASTIAPETGPDRLWDYSKALLRGDSIQPMVYLKNTDTASFPTSNRYFVQEFDFSGVTLSARIIEENTTSQHAGTGFSMDRQGFDLSGQTQNNGDSLVFPAQKQAFKEPMTLLKYPATYGSNWKYQDRVVYQFNLTVHYIIFNYNNDKGERVQNVTAMDSIVGWGKMKVPLDTGSSGAYNVLMVKGYEKVNDSFYLKGKPAPAPLLAAFGITNGSDTFTYSYRFYRQWNSAPFMTFIMDSTYTRVLDVYYDPDHLSLTGIAPAGSLTGFTTYPNPVADGRLNLNFTSKEAQEGTLKVFNANGQETIHKHLSIESGPNHTLAEFPAGTPAGLYFYHMLDANGNKLQSGKIVVAQP